MEYMVEPELKFVLFGTFAEIEINFIEIVVTLAVTASVAVLALTCVSIDVISALSTIFTWIALAFVHINC